MVPLPPTLRVKCRVLKIGKCTWSACHVVTSPKLQANWISECCVHLKEYTGYQQPCKGVQVHTLPSRTLRSNLVTLVWLVVLIWNPIALFFFFWAWFIPSGWSMIIHQAWSISNAFPNSLIDSNVSLKWKQRTSKELGYTPSLVTL
jgi:hypothetical protein